MKIYDVHRFEQMWGSITELRKEIARLDARIDALMQMFEERVPERKILKFLQDYPDAERGLRTQVIVNGINGDYHMVLRMLAVMERKGVLQREGRRGNYIWRLSKIEREIQGNGETDAI